MRAQLAQTLALLGVVIWPMAASAAAEPEVASAELLQHYYHLHKNPELSLQEHQTAAYMGQQLQALGYEVEPGVGATGVVAILRNGPGKTVMYRADMDGLPVAENTGLPYQSEVKVTNDAGELVPVMHACGHDVHMTVLLGVAARMAADRAAWQGTLLLVLQPAEELGAGAKAMLADGLQQRFPRADYNLALHVSAELPAGMLGGISGYAMANVDSVDVTVFGVGGHGAYPHKTKDPVVLAAQIVTALQTIVSRSLSPLDSAVVTVGSIHGGSKHNIIPDQVKLQLTVRSYSDSSRQLILQRIADISRHLAEAADIPADKLPVITVRDEYTPAVYNDPALVERLWPALAASLGEARLQRVEPVMAGEDFSRYGRTDPKIPSALFWLGAVEPEQYRLALEQGGALPALHSAQFAPAPAATIGTGVQAVTSMLNSILAPQ